MTPDFLGQAGLIIGAIIAGMIITFRSFKTPPNLTVPALANGSSSSSNGSSAKTKTDEWQKIASILHGDMENEKIKAMEEQIRMHNSYDPRIIRLEANVQQLQDNYKMLFEALMKRGS